MNYNNVLNCKTIEEFRNWLSNNHNAEKECYVLTVRGKLTINEILWYLDAVEEAAFDG